jgi:outer membrane protein assembly factor BamE (lipoprotein component of BamABCDE complex)
MVSYFHKLSFVFFVGLCGCETIDIHGHEIDLEKIQDVKVGKTTKQQVTETFGTPSAVSTFNNNTWFYMSETTSTRAFFSPTILKSNVTRIDFDNKGVVQTLSSLTEADRMIVSHIYRTTPTAGYKFGVIEQLFGNIGRFNGKDPDMGSRR